DPQFGMAHNNLGCLLHEKNLEQAIREYRKAIQLDKGHALPHCNLARALSDKGLVDEAIAECQEALRLNKDLPEAHNNLGSALYKKGQPEEAIAKFREVICIKRDYANAHCNLGYALMQQGQFQQAVEEFRLGHEYGSRNPHWPYPSVQWLRNAERLA